jgi:hypothetical protein
METNMCDAPKMIRASIGMAFIVMALFLPSAYAQGLKKGSHAAPTVEDKPRVDEKAYNSALERIPTPKKPYDPWGQVHDTQPAKPGGKQ